MNYLAHALLSPGDPLITMGNLWGDLLKPKDYEKLQEGVRQGVLMHRKIDAFTDQHPSVDEIIRLLRPHQGKYTPVVADVLMDYVLSKNWSKYSNQPLEKFCKTKYAMVVKHLKYIPERLHPRINAMLSHQWLESCASDERMERTLFMLSKRAAFENLIPDAMIPYHQHQETIDKLFLDFFGDMQKHISLQNAD